MNEIFRIYLLISLFILVIEFVKMLSLGNDDDSERHDSIEMLVVALGWLFIILYYTYKRIFKRKRL